MWNTMFALILGYGDERTSSNNTPNLRRGNGITLVDVPTGDTFKYRSIRL